MPGNLTSTYTPELWATALVPFVALHQIPLEFAVAALTEESTGNPCAIGDPTQYGDDGNPRELGIYQLYNPDDLKLVKLTGSELRAYCSPQKVPYKLKDGTTVMGPSQEVIRPLTADEMAAQARGAVEKIASSRAYAAHYAALAGVKWPSDGVDFWRLVKLVHGLPGLVNNGIAHVTTYLGRPPASWAEYRHLIESGAVKCDPATEAKRSKYPEIFNNAERATATMQGKAIA